MSLPRRWRRRPPARHIRLRRRYGITDAYELEAMEPAELARELSRAIDEVIDIDLFNQELAADSRAAKLVAIQEHCAAFFKSFREWNRL